jgi:hypothetical protein
MTTATISVPARSLADPTRPSTAGEATDSESAPLWMAVTGTVLVLAGVVLTLLVFAWPGDAPEIALAVPAFLGVAVGLLLVTARTGVSVTAEHVVLHFRPLPRRRIRRDRLVAARIVEADARSYGGVGLRVARRRRAILLTPGVGIELTDHRGRVTFVRTEHPDRVLQALADRSGGTARFDYERVA